MNSEDDFRKWQKGQKGFKIHVGYVQPWQNDAFLRLLKDMEKSKTKEVIDNEMMAMDLLETVVDDSANLDAVAMLDAIGIKC
jgi:hypothetical protein